jgi:hypothetical protein
MHTINTGYEQEDFFKHIKPSLRIVIPPEKDDDYIKCDDDKKQHNNSSIFYCICIICNCISSRSIVKPILSST